MPELSRRVAAPYRLIAQLHELNAANPAYDIDGLHDLVDRELTPLMLLGESHPAARFLADFVRSFADRRPPLLTNVAALTVFRGDPQQRLW